MTTHVLYSVLIYLVVLSYLLLFCVVIIIKLSGCDNQINKASFYGEKAKYLSHGGCFLGNNEVGLIKDTVDLKYRNPKTCC
jgi:hypothetical protein